MKNLVPLSLAFLLLFAAGCERRDAVPVGIATPAPTAVPSPSPSPEVKKGVFEKAGEKMDEGLRKTGEGLDKAGDKIEEGFDKAGEKLKGK